MILNQTGSFNFDVYKIVNSDYLNLNLKKKKNLNIISIYFSVTLSLLISPP